MTDQPTTPAPADTLRQRIAEALMAWADGNNNPKYAPIRRPETVTKNAYARADAVLAVVQPELDALAALYDAESRTLAEVDERCDRHAAALERVRALHQPMQRGPFTICAQCSGWDGEWRCRGLITEYPCPTIAALQPVAGACDHDSQVIDHEGAQFWACLKCGLNLGPVTEPVPAHDGPSVAECRADDRRWPLEKEGL